MTAVEMISSEIGAKLVAARRGAKSIVVATDGSEAAISAFRAAKLIGEKTETVISVLSVLEPMPVLLPAIDGMSIPSDLDRSREDAQRRNVKDQMKMFDEKGDWSLDIITGRAPQSIVQFAHEQKAELIIIGLNKHGIVGRLLGEETAMAIARYSDVPLLVASSSMTRLPHRVLVAMDLNPDGLQQAPESLGLIADTPSISCVHVKPRSEFLGIDWVQFDSEYDLAMRERFKSFEQALAAVHLRPDLISLHGDPAREIGDFAAYSKAELVVAGVRRRRGRARALSGRMATRILRLTECSVLIVPNLVPVNVPAQWNTDVSGNSRDWSALLREFTMRNAGRIVSLEVDDPEMGALVEASNYPFLGADYDHKDGRLTLTLGNTRDLDRHLSRSISEPGSVSVLSVEGRDTVLAVTHGKGQTLLKF